MLKQPDVVARAEAVVNNSGACKNTYSLTLNMQILIKTKAS